MGRWDFKERVRDYAIGATALASGAKLVTDNLKGFWVVARGKRRHRLKKLDPA
ncbi:MAG: hypothetical protein QMC89_05340 [Candidatus Hodarchaeaceae archaeon]|nr:hypothetical protein [Candidatus Hodarchaeaceae archaeon]